MKIKLDQNALMPERAHEFGRAEMKLGIFCDTCGELVRTSRVVFMGNERKKRDGNGKEIMCAKCFNRMLKERREKEKQNENQT